jgi:hypothetical protein
MLTSIQDMPPAPPGTRIAYSRGEFKFGELRVPSGSGPHPVANHILEIYKRIEAWQGPADPSRRGSARRAYSGRSDVDERGTKQ